MVLKVTQHLPPAVANQLDSYTEAFEIFSHIRDPKVLKALGPSGVRGLLLKRGKQGVPTQMPANHSAHFDWTYPHDNQEMADLYKLAKQGQWDGDDLPWHTDVDPLNPEVPLLPENFFDFSALRDMRIFLTEDESRKFTYSMTSWMLSQFLHGEQGALFAAAQVTEAVQFFDGKLYGATQVMDEARHVEVFQRYLESKLNKLYTINDNLFVIIDSLMTDGRWDMKFLGMQIMVEGLALGAFGMIYKGTKEPLLKQLLAQVIQDEARHVHYGVVALREHIVGELSEAERQEREDWAFEIALLMRNRFMAYEVYEEWFEGIMSREKWRQLISTAPGMEEFRTVMFSRLVPNLREIGLLSNRIKPAYDSVGLMKYFGGASATSLTGDDMLKHLDAQGAIKLNVG
jgi:hypothetical protein